MEKEWKKLWHEYGKATWKIYRRVAINFVIFIILVQLLNQSSAPNAIMMVSLSIIYFYLIYQEIQLTLQLGQIAKEEGEHLKGEAITGLNTLAKGKSGGIGHLANQGGKYVLLFVQVALYLIFIAFLLNN